MYYDQGVGYFYEDFFLFYCWNGKKKKKKGIENCKRF